jgi:hypothetical protein
VRGLAKAVDTYEEKGFRELANSPFWEAREGESADRVDMMGGQMHGLGRCGDTVPTHLSLLGLAEGDPLGLLQ